MGFLFMAGGTIAVSVDVSCVPNVRRVRSRYFHPVILESWEIRSRDFVKCVLRVFMRPKLFISDQRGLLKTTGPLLIRL